MNNELIHCYFTEKLNLGFWKKFTEGTDIKIKYCSAWQCYFCSNLYSNIENCKGQPGVLYNFNTQNLITFENDLKYKGDIPLVTYIDFETTAPTDESLDPDNKKMYAVSYVIIFAFHRALNIDQIITERSLGDLTEKLTSLNYLTCEQLLFKNPATHLQLRHVL